VAGTAAATTASATSGKPSRRLGGSAVIRTIRGAENRELNRVLFPRALWASNLLLLVQHNLLKVGLAIFTYIFVNGHFRSSSNILQIITAQPIYDSIPKTNGPG
jgi:hypothetical protein